MSTQRYTASGSAGQRDGRTYAVLDTQDRQGGKGLRRVSFHRTFDEARAEAKRLNTAAATSEPSPHYGCHGHPMNTCPRCTLVANRHSDGNLYAITEQEHADGYSPGPVHTDGVHGPWTPIGSIVVDGITVVPQRQASWIEVTPTSAHRRELTGMARDLAARVTAAESAAAIGRATGSRAAHATVERVRYDVDGTRHAELVDAADWSAAMESAYGPEIAEHDRRQTARAVADVFIAAREARLRRRLIKASPALRDALSLT